MLCCVLCIVQSDQLHLCVLANQTLCSLLDCLLTEDNTPADSPRELYEIYFVFACVWAFGGALFQDHVCVLFISVFSIVDNQTIPIIISQYDIVFFPTFNPAE